jgi:hypothetical protein
MDPSAALCDPAAALADGVRRHDRRFDDLEHRIDDVSDRLELIVKRASGVAHAFRNRQVGGAPQSRFAPISAVIAS